MAKNTAKALEIMTGLYPVEGFNPSDATREILADDGVSKEEYLPLVYKKAWARKVFPLHRCEAKIVIQSENYIVAEAKFYCDNDAAKAHIGEGSSYCKVEPDPYAPDQELAKKEAFYLARQYALGSAKSRAYTDAGFGLQYFADAEIDDIEAAEKSVKATETPSPSEMLTVKKVEPEQAQTACLEPEQENEPEQEVKTTPVGKKRATQYEMTKKDNEKLVSLKSQLPRLCESILTSSAGSVEYNNATSKLETIKKEWHELTQSIAKRMQSEQVRKDREADAEYSFVSETYDQALAEAKMAIREANSNTDDTTATATTTENAVCVDTPTNETPLQAESEKQMALFPEMDIDNARNVVCSVEPYQGELLGEMFDDAIKRHFFPNKLFANAGSLEEKRAIKLLIESDDGLKAFCERKGIDLSLAG